MKRQFLSLEKAIQLEEVGGILGQLEPQDDLIFVIGTSEKEEDENIPYTKLLQELIILNKRRREILEQFSSSSELITPKQ